MMSERSITSIPIQKLGHEIPEIRIRALHTLISKFELGAAFDNELPRSIELLRKLIEWFRFEPCTEERSVIYLIGKIIHSPTGSSIIKYKGSKSLIQDLRSIRSKLSKDLQPSLDTILEHIKSVDEKFDIVPPLVSDLPLSYRSGETMPEYTTSWESENTPKERENNIGLKYNSSENFTNFRSETTERGQRIREKLETLKDFEQKSSTTTQEKNEGSLKFPSERRFEISQADTFEGYEKSSGKNIPISSNFSSKVEILYPITQYSKKTEFSDDIKIIPDKSRVNTSKSNFAISRNGSQLQYNESGLNLPDKNSTQFEERTGVTVTTSSSQYNSNLTTNSENTISYKNTMSSSTSTRDINFPSESTSLKGVESSLTNLIFTSDKSTSLKDTKTSMSDMKDEQKSGILKRSSQKELLANMSDSIIKSGVTDRQIRFRDISSTHTERKESEEGYEIKNNMLRSQSESGYYYGRNSGNNYVSSEGTEKTGTDISTSRSSDTLRSTIPPLSTPHILYNTLPWQTLIPSDTQVLCSLHDSLSTEDPQEGGPAILLRTCKFLETVALRDFPPELFLQRPQIIAALWNLVANGISTRIVNAAFRCLLGITKKLMVRIREFGDPCMKQNSSRIIEKRLLITTENTESNKNSSKNTSEISDEDTHFQTQQLSIPIFCLETLHCVLNYMSEKRHSFQDRTLKNKIHVTMNTALQLIDSLVNVLNICILPTIWDADKSDSTLDKLSGVLNDLGNILEQLRLMVAASEMEYLERMCQLQVLISTTTLIRILIPISRANSVLPRSLKNALASSLLDASFGRVFPETHEHLVQYAKEFASRHENESFLKYKEMKQVCKAMSSAVTILRYDKTFNKPSLLNESLRLIFSSLPSLEFHRNFQLIEQFFNLCIKININNLEEVQKLINDIVVILLSHEDLQIRTETYKHCHKLIKNSLGINHVKNKTLEETGSEVVFFVQAKILNEIATYGVTSTDFDISTIAEDIIIQILKCKFLVSDNIWQKFINAIILCFPILHCHADRGTPLGKAILKMLDPDVCTSIFVPNLEVLKGNLRLLFHKDEIVRKEAVARLCWLLTSEQDYEKKVPKIKTLENCTLSNLFQTNHLVDLTKTRNVNQYYQIGNLYQVLELLDSDEIDVSMRRSAMSQISVMLSDHCMHTSFIERGGLQIVLRILHDSLLEVVPEKASRKYLPFCVTILKNLCLHNSVIRQELAMNIDLFYCFLRTLMLTGDDKCVQQDGSILLMTLLFSDCILSSAKGISLLHIVTNNLCLPFKCNVHGETSQNALKKLSITLLSDNWCKSTLRMHWNMEYYGGMHEILKNDMSSEDNINFSPDLCLTPQDLTALKATSVLFCCQDYLYQIQNATVHADVLESLRGLSGYLTLWLLTNNKSMLDKLLSLPWKETFGRFLSAPPANNDDQSLLIELVQFLTVLVKLYVFSEHCWIKEMILTSSQNLPKILQVEVHCEDRSISLELLLLISKCVMLDKELVFITKSTENMLKTNVDCWVYIVYIITENLKYNDSGQFYNLAYLDSLLSCLVDVTVLCGWSEIKHHEFDTGKLLQELVVGLWQLLDTFHRGRGSDAQSSFMGLSVTRNALIAMNHVLAEMQRFRKNWEVYWFDSTLTPASLESVCSLWKSRDCVVRSSALQLVSGLGLSSRGATIVVMGADRKIWPYTLSILLDKDEPAIVREQAAALLTNLCGHATSSPKGVALLPLAHAAFSCKGELLPNQTIMVLLQENNFFEQLNDLLLSLHLECNFEFESSGSSCSGPLSSQSHQMHYKSNLASNTSDNQIITTPGLVKNTAQFVSNLLCLEPEVVTSALHEYHVVRSYFRCLCSPPLAVTDLRLSLTYVDVMEMCTAVCALLTRCVLISEKCRYMCLNTRDCLHVVVSLLNPELFELQQTDFINLRNKLWCEIFSFLSALLNAEKQNSQNGSTNQGIVSSIVLNGNNKHFIKAVCMSLKSKIPQLQRNALKFIISLLSPEDNNISTNKAGKSSSSISIVDNTKNKSYEDIENIDPQKLTLNSMGNYGREKKYDNIQVILNHCDAFDKSSVEPNQSFGNVLCKNLLNMYEIQYLENNRDIKRKELVIGALSSLLFASNEAKKFALQEKLLDTVIGNLKSLNLELSLHSLEALRISEKRKINPLLKELNLTIGLINNFALTNSAVKSSCVSLDLPDQLHKFFVWFQLDRTLLSNAMCLLSTLTTESEEVCQALAFTTPNLGAGPRRTPTGVCLLNVVADVVVKEMPAVSRARDLMVMQLGFEILSNVCCVSECRSILAKQINLFQSLSRMHPTITKHQKPWDNVERLALDFLQMWTFTAEGQVAVGRRPELLELLFSLVHGSKTQQHRLAALCVIRNVAFHQGNRVILLSSMEFLQLLHHKLTSGNWDEKNTVITIIWTLTANNQRSKNVIKCTGLDVVLQDIIKQRLVQCGGSVDSDSLQEAVYVLGMLRDNFNER